MKFTLSTRPFFSQKTPVSLRFAFENERLSGPPPFQKLMRGLGNKEFRGAACQSLMLHAAGSLPANRLLLVGLGKKSAVTPETIRRAAGSAVRALRAAGLEQATIEIRNQDQLAPLTEALILADYQFNRFKAADDHRTPLKSVAYCLPPHTDLRRARTLVDQARITAESTNYARGIADLPGNIIYPATLADQARKLAREAKLKCTVLDKAALVRGKFGGLLAVGGGSQHEPRLIVLEYRPARARNRRPIALVGKAITFDSGGLSIKPSDKMDEMKFDKCGGIAVLGALRSIAKRKLPVHVIGIIASAENLPGGRSYRPGDIVTSYRGKDPRGVTIEVLNTDAEGRIVLGDALVYARQRQPAAIVDLATLTGACVVALGDLAAGLMGNHPKLQEQLRRAAETSGDAVWPLPLNDDYRALVKSHVADHKNTGGRYGGAITAAAFLDKYVGEVPWAHLDIAGTGWTTSQKPYLDKGATGFGVRLLTAWLAEWRGL